MSKVGEEDSSLEYSQVRLASKIKVKIKKKKKRKDLQRLRYNVLKARKKSRNKAADFTKKSEQRAERKTSCNRLLPEPNIGIYRNGVASKQLAQERRFRLPHGNETIVSNDVMELFDKEDYSSKKTKTIPNVDGNRGKMTIPFSNVNRNRDRMRISDVDGNHGGLTIPNTNEIRNRMIKSSPSQENEKTDENNPMESPIEQNNAPEIEVIKSVRRWRWSPMTCFEALCVKICQEVFMNLPLEGFPDPLQKTQLFLVDLHMGSYDYSREIESLVTFGESDKEIPPPKQFPNEDKKREIIETTNHEISGNERRITKSNPIPSRPQIPRVHNQKNKVPDAVRANDFNIPVKNLPLTPIDRKIMFTKPSYHVSPPIERHQIELKYIETPSVIVRTTRKEDFPRKEKFNPIKTNYRRNEGIGRNKKPKKSEIPGKSDLRPSMTFPSSVRQLNLDFGQVHNHKSHEQASRNRKSRHRDLRIDETEISSNAFLQNFKVLSCNDNPSKDAGGWSRKQGRGYQDDVQQPKKYFAGQNESISFDLPRPIPVYHYEERRRKRDYGGGNLEKKYDPVRRYSSNHGYHNNIDPLNSRTWITPEPQRNRPHKSHERDVCNNNSNRNIALDPQEFYYHSDTAYNSYYNQFSPPIDEKNDYPLHRAVTFNDINSHHYY